MLSTQKIANLKSVAEKAIPILEDIEVFRRCEDKPQLTSAEMESISAALKLLKESFANTEVKPVYEKLEKYWTEFTKLGAIVFFNNHKKEPIFSITNFESEDLLEDIIPRVQHFFASTFRVLFQIASGERSLQAIVNEFKPFNDNQAKFTQAIKQLEKQCEQQDYDLHWMPLNNNESTIADAVQFTPVEPIEESRKKELIEILNAQGYHASIWQGSVVVSNVFNPEPASTSKLTHEKESKETISVVISLKYQEEVYVFSPENYKKLLEKIQNNKTKYNGNALKGSDLITKEGFSLTCSYDDIEKALNHANPINGIINITVPAIPILNNYSIGKLSESTSVVQTHLIVLSLLLILYRQLELSVDIENFSSHLFHNSITNRLWFLCKNKQQANDVGTKLRSLGLKAEAALVKGENLKWTILLDEPTPQYFAKLESLIDISKAQSTADEVITVAKSKGYQDSDSKSEEKGMFSGLQRGFMNRNPANNKNSTLSHATIGQKKTNSNSSVATVGHFSSTTQSLSLSERICGKKAKRNESQATESSDTQPTSMRLCQIL